MIGITYGTFDFCHNGHINLLRRIKDRCDYLIVGLSTDSFNAMKGKQAFYSYEDRKQMLYNTNLIDLIIPEKNWEQKIKDITTYNVDMFFMGSDWTGKFDFLKPYCEVIYLPRTYGISSTQFRNLLRRE